MTQVYLIRHGFTPANNAKYNNQRDLWRIAGDADMPLEMEYGEEQARELGQFLDMIPGKALILVSPYHRTRQTLEIALREMTGDYEINVCEDLHENHSGVHYAKTKEEVLEIYPEAEEFYQRIEEYPLETHYLGGECEYDVRDRVKKVSERILNTSQTNCYDNIIFLNSIMRIFITIIFFFKFNNSFLNKVIREFLNFINKIKIYIFIYNKYIIII